MWVTVKRLSQNGNDTKKHAIASVELESKKSSTHHTILPFEKHLCPARHAVHCIQVVLWMGPDIIHPPGLAHVKFHILTHYLIFQLKKRPTPKQQQQQPKQKLQGV